MFSKNGIASVVLLLIVVASPLVSSQSLKSETLGIQPRAPTAEQGPLTGITEEMKNFFSLTPEQQKATVTPSIPVTHYYTWVNGSQNVWVRTFQFPVTGLRYDTPVSGFNILNWESVVPAPAGGVSYVWMSAKISPKSTKTPSEITSAATDTITSYIKKAIEDKKLDELTKDALDKEADTAIADAGGSPDYTVSPTFFAGLGATFGAITNGSTATGSFTVGPYLGLWKFTLLVGYDILKNQVALQFGTEIDSFDINLGDSKTIFGTKIITKNIGEQETVTVTVPATQSKK